MTSRLRILLLGASLSTLGACASALPPNAKPVSMAADRHEITVNQADQRLEIQVVAGQVTLTPESRAQVASFADGYNHGGHGALIMSTPSGGANADAASLLAHQTRMALTEGGVPYAAVAGSTYDASGAAEAPIILTYSAFEAVAPECRPLWEQDLAHQSNNQPWESFGCATQANLAAMIEDPHDLLAPRTEEPRDGGRRATVMGHYRAGEPTGATRSDDERVAISNAVR